MNPVLPISVRKRAPAAGYRTDSAVAGSPWAWAPAQIAAHTVDELARFSGA